MLEVCVVRHALADMSKVERTSLPVVVVAVKRGSKKERSRS